jgi:hypothetical protein
MTGDPPENTQRLSLKREHTKAPFFGLFLLLITITITITIITIFIAFQIHLLYESWCNA